jgi:hypothetical protein
LYGIPTSRDLSMHSPELLCSRRGNTTAAAPDFSQLGSCGRRLLSYMKDTLRFLAGTLCIVSMVTNLYAQAARPSPAVPIEPIKPILDAFGSHQLVALGEPHGNEQAAAFRVALIRDARFADVVNDIVIESGNSRFQDVVDAFVSGQRVPDTTLRQVWPRQSQTSSGNDRFMNSSSARSGR